MKIRAGFVSNSSSSSFVVRKEYLSKFQAPLIRKHMEIAHLFEMYGVGGSHNDRWYIEENSVAIGGYTSMNNFDMEKFMKEIGVPDDVVEWGEFLDLPKED